MYKVITFLISLFLISCSHNERQSTFIWEKCFSRQVYFKDDILDKRIYGNLLINISKDNDILFETAKVQTPACKEITAIIKITKSEENLKVINDLLESKGTICSGDVCGLEFKQEVFGLIANGKMTINQSNLIISIDKIDKLIKRNIPIKVEFTDEFVAGHEELIFLDYKLINPEYEPK